MEITEISVTYGATQSLKDFCNVRVDIRMTARLAGGEDPAWVKQRLLDEARWTAQREIDDALEADGQQARYYDGPRYCVGYKKETLLVAIIPDEQAGTLWDMNFVSHPSVRPGRQMRRGHATKVAARLAEYLGDRYTVVDCSDGDLSRLEIVRETPRPEQEAG